MSVRTPRYPSQRTVDSFVALDLRLIGAKSAPKSVHGRTAASERRARPDDPPERKSKSRCEAEVRQILLVHWTAARSREHPLSDAVGMECVLAIALEACEFLSLAHGTEANGATSDRERCAIAACYEALRYLS